MSLSFDEARKYLNEKGFYIVNHCVFCHHARKDFEEYDVIRDRFYILPVKDDYLHVALVEHEYGDRGVAVQIRYTCAGDDLLYGLRVKYKSGGSRNNEEDINELNKLIALNDLRTNERYVKARFRHNRIKAKVRAFFIMLKGIWKDLFSKQ